MLPKANRLANSMSDDNWTLTATLAGLFLTERKQPQQLACFIIPCGGQHGVMGILTWVSLRIAMGILAGRA